MQKEASLVSLVLLIIIASDAGFGNTEKFELCETEFTPAELSKLIIEPPFPVAHPLLAEVKKTEYK